MQKSFLSFVFDFLFYCFVVFLITFVWVRKVVHSWALIWIYSLSITLLISIIIFLVLKKKIYFHISSKKEEKEKQQILNNLIFAQKSEIDNFLIKFFSNETITKHRDFFVIKSPEKPQKFAVFHNFCLDELSQSGIVEMIKKSEKIGVFNIYVFATKFNKNCENFVKNLINIKIKLIPFNSFYNNFIKKQNIKPNLKEKYKEKTKFSFKELLFVALNKAKTKQYFLTGLIFLMGSIFLRYNVYYLIFTTLMFVLCLFSHFNKTFNKKTDDPFEN